MSPVALPRCCGEASPGSCTDRSDGGCSTPSTAQNQHTEATGSGAVVPWSRAAVSAPCPRTCSLTMMQIPTPASALFLGSVRDEIGAVGQQETWEHPGRCRWAESLPTSPAPPKTTFVLWWEANSCCTSGQMCGLFLDGCLACKGVWARGLGCYKVSAMIPDLRLSSQC